MEEPKSEEPLENGHVEAIPATTEAVPEQPKEETEMTTTTAIKIESSDISTEQPTEVKVEKVAAPVKPEPDFNLTTKNLERIREELRQEEILQGRKSPFKSETASPVKLETVLIS